MIYVILIVALGLMIFLPLETMIRLGVSDDNLLCSFCYMCAHASWLHFVVNAISTLLLLHYVNKLYISRFDENPKPVQCIGYLCAVLAGAACASTTPTVGASGCTFFLLGSLLMLNPTVRQLKSYIWIALAVAVQAYFGKSNVALHLFAFTEGAIFICIREFIYQYKNSTGLFEPVAQEDVNAD